MQKRRPSLVLAAVALTPLLLMPSPALTEERKGSWESGFFGGNTFFAQEQQLSNESHYGVRVGWHWRPAYEIEFQYLRSASAEVQDPGTTLVTSPIVFFTLQPAFSIDSLTARFVINPRNERRRFKPFVYFGAGSMQYTSDPKLQGDEQALDSALIVTVGGGLRQRLTGRMAFRAEVATEYAMSEVFHHEYVNVGLTWVFGGGPVADSDGDGILDISDRCPDTPKGALVDKHDGCPWDLDGDGVMEGVDRCAETPRGWPVDESGCPLDSDGDGVPDGADKCADTPKGAIVKTDGCPLDSDGDTVLDGIDRCPDTPKGAVVDPPDGANPGCPHDSDKDGVPDGVDQCALTPEGATVDDKGCPADTDGDRVLDGIDKCADTAKGAKIDREGCPRVRLDKAEPYVLENVRFVEGTELYPGADAWFALAADALEYWTDVTVELGVYTDKGGSRTLAQRRAEVLKAWLVSKGIEAKRIAAKGYGPVNFIADNDTDEGREKNRRVEIKRLSGDVRKHAKPAPEAPPATPAEPQATPEPKPAEPQATPEPKPAEPQAAPEAAPSPAPPASPGGSPPGR